MGVLLLFLVAFTWLVARAKGYELNPARVLLTIVGVLRYHERWLEATRLLTVVGEENAELRGELNGSHLTRVELARQVRDNAEAHRVLVDELQSTIADLCVEVAVLEGHRDAELIRRSEEIGRVLAASAKASSEAQAKRAEQAWRQAVGR